MILHAPRLFARAGFAFYARASLAGLAVLLLGACERGNVAVSESATRSANVAMNDLLAVRVALKGGPARVHMYHRPDSIIWNSATPAPAVARILGFDEEGGSLAYADAKGSLVRLDLRSGRVSSVAKPVLTRLVSSDGSTIYGIAADGMIHRVTPTARWTYKPAGSVRELLPQPDGSLLISTDRGESTHVFRMRPPEPRLLDTVAIAKASQAVTTQVGDRVYFATSPGLVAVRSRDLAASEPIELEQRSRAIAPTPSGDRLYVLADSSEGLLVVDRYRERVEHTIELPGVAVDLRMDPLGRYVLARSATSDSAWVIAVGTDKVIGTIASAWRSDLPAIAADGTLLTVRGRDVVAIDPETRRAVRTIAGGATDFWHLFTWSGFRPRAAGLDEPVTFAGSDSVQDDTSYISAQPGLDSGEFGPRPAESGRVATIDSAFQPPAFTVSFATLLQEEGARSLATTITVSGKKARVVAATRDGIPIYRVVLGPYPSRVLAENAGRATGKPYWVFEGNP